MWIGQFRSVKRLPYKGAFLLSPQSGKNQAKTIAGFLPDSCRILVGSCRAREILVDFQPKITTCLAIFQGNIFLILSWLVADDLKPGMVTSMAAF